MNDKLIPIELRVRRDAMMSHLKYLIHATKSDPNRKPELDAATKILSDINDSIETIHHREGMDPETYFSKLKIFQGSPNGCCSHCGRFQ